MQGYDERYADDWFLDGHRHTIACEDCSTMWHDGRDSGMELAITLMRDAGFTLEALIEQHERAKAKRAAEQL